MADPLLARSFEDVLLDKLVTAATAYSAQQAGLSAAVAFRADRDLLAQPSAADLQAKGPLVIFTVDTINPALKGSAQAGEIATVTVNADMFVWAREAAGVAQGGDQKAMARLYYFKEQIRATVFRYAGFDLGFPKGIVGNKREGSFQLFAPPSDSTDEWVIGGRYQFTVEGTFTPADIAGTPLAQIFAHDSTRWTGLWTYP